MKKEKNHSQEDSNKKRILVTGGLGFVGHHLIKKLIAKNYFPVIVDNLSHSSFDSLFGVSKEKYFFAKADIRDFEAMKRIAANFNPKIVIHLAAIHFIPYCNKHPEEVMEVNLKGTENLLKIAVQSKVDNFLFASTAAIYAPCSSRHKEDSVLGPVDIYGQSKKLAEEKIIDCAVKNPALRFIILRLFNIYGHGDKTPHFIPEMIKRIRNSSEALVGNLETIRDYVYIDDIISAILKIIERDKSFDNQIYNLGTGIGTSGAEIIELLSFFYGKDISLRQDGKFLREIDRLKLVADARKFFKKYNWSPRYKLEEGLKKLCEE